VSSRDFDTEACILAHKDPGDTGPGQGGEQQKSRLQSSRRELSENRIDGENLAALPVEIRT